MDRQHTSLGRLDAAGALADAGAMAALALSRESWASAGMGSRSAGERWGGAGWRLCRRALQGRLQGIPAEQLGSAWYGMAALRICNAGRCVVSPARGCLQPILFPLHPADLLKLGLAARGLADTVNSAWYSGTVSPLLILPFLAATGSGFVLPACDLLAAGQAKVGSRHRWLVRSDFLELFECVFIVQAVVFNPVLSFPVVVQLSVPARS